MAKPNAGANDNDNDKSLPVVTQGHPLVFDNSGCEIPSPLPSRRFCGVRLVGRGVATGGWMVCGDHRAEPAALPNNTPNLRSS